MGESTVGDEGIQREELASVIERAEEAIEERWLARVKPKNAPHLSPTELRNSMAEYLKKLAKALRSEKSAQAGGSATWADVAREHAATRVQYGFDIDQLVREFIILRQVLFEIIEERGLSFDVAQAAHLSDLVEGAIVAAVKSYTEARDYQLRKQQAEHIGFLTHELRNPLAAATLGAVSLRRTLTLSTEQARAFDVIQRNHRRLSDLIDGVLLVQRFDAHQVKPEPAVVTLEQVLNGPLTSAAAAARAKGLTFEARYDPNALVYVDPKLVISAVENVVDNAVKYSDAGLVQVLAEDGPNAITISVRDNCGGISDEELRTIFEPFTRGHSDKPGTGLGLAIARRAMEAQGGTIRAESTGVSGCHFRLTLPKPHP